MGCWAEEQLDLIQTCVVYSELPETSFHMQQVAPFYLEMYLDLLTISRFQAKKRRDMTFWLISDLSFTCYLDPFSHFYFTLVWYGFSS